MSAYDVEQDERATLRAMRGKAAREEVRAVAARLEAGRALTPEERNLLASIARDFASRMPERRPGRPGLRRNVAPVDVYIAREVYGKSWADIEAEFGINDRTGRKMIGDLKVPKKAARKKAGRNS